MTKIGEEDINNDEAFKDLHKSSEISLMSGKLGKTRMGLIKKLGTIKSFDYRFKIVIIGTSGTGKTSLLLRFSENKYNDDHLVTIGVDFKTKSL